MFLFVISVGDLEHQIDRANDRQKSHEETTDKDSLINPHTKGTYERARQEHSVHSS